MAEYRSSTVVRGLVCLAGSLALFASITSPLLARTNESVTVLTTVNRKVAWQVTDGGVTVSGNTFWALYAETPQGTIRILGLKSAAQAVDFPEGTTTYTIVAE